ncbi:DUF3791 domain-containing protein [uncultured Treponema sp.]|uniref:DUF3791 domain-containing protein n=1 Tax=uncultured Treponema sp. TaxID=162155 RepID=UPI0025D91036|nr:DUF3791 domain-containing protein [uncultured Treponema sp.]
MQKEDLYQIQGRLFRLAQLKWNISASKCSEIFKKYDIYGYIEACYELFHVQGDEASISDIEKYLENLRCKK